jgi:hypothetical protein
LAFTWRRANAKPQAANSEAIFWTAIKRNPEFFSAPQNPLECPSNPFFPHHRQKLQIRSFCQARPIFCPKEKEIPAPEPFSKYVGWAVHEKKTLAQRDDRGGLADRVGRPGATAGLCAAQQYHGL